MTAGRLHDGWTSLNAMVLEGDPIEKSERKKQRPNERFVRPFIVAAPQVPETLGGLAFGHLGKQASFAFDDRFVDHELAASWLIRKFEHHF
jgi:hypothetical protein